ncbi:hypothetical protein GCM10009850_033690 [Nonomuraea monospora]|uniref:Uncharacterized protein n=1 Tax=Nonomuraea monospora TaxID=568818 RepID=A0ABN3CFA6_9ACTN
MSLELPAALAAVEEFLGWSFPEGDEDALVRLGDGYEDGLVRPGGGREARPGGGDGGEVRPGAGALVEGLGLKASAGLVLARKGVTLLQYGLTAALLAETLAAGGALASGEAPAPVLRRAGQRALDAVTGGEGVSGGGGVVDGDAVTDGDGVAGGDAVTDGDGVAGGDGTEA